LEAYDIATETLLDIILMDLNMPIMDGFTSCIKIKSFYEESKIFGGGLGCAEEEQRLHYSPFIVAVSASMFDSNLIRQCQDHKFDDWKCSPLSAKLIQEEIIG